MHSHSDALFNSLADPTRRAIFERLTRDGEQTVHTLTGPAGVSQQRCPSTLASSSSPALARGTRGTPYSAEPQGLAPLVDWMCLYGAFWQNRFDRLETLLKRMDQ